MRRIVILTLFLPPLFILCSCVERKLHIKSKPDKAVVFLDGKKVGETPCEVPFTFYGVRDISLEKEGYKPISKKVDLSIPAYEYFPLDFISDVVIPVNIKDTHTVSFELEKDNSVINTEDLLKRAKELREKAKNSDSQSK